MQDMWRQEPPALRCFKTACTPFWWGGAFVCLPRGSFSCSWGFWICRGKRQGRGARSCLFSSPCCSPPSAFLIRSQNMQGAAPSCPSRALPTPWPPLPSTAAARALCWAWEPRSSPLRARYCFTVRLQAPFTA